MMRNIFFEPYVGKEYKNGIHGKKILVLGASFYCNRIQCPYFSKCTSTRQKDSSAYDEICPEYQQKGKKLHCEPSYCIEDAPQTYERFASYMGKHLNTDNYDEVWEHLAFTNYVQYFLPAENGKYRETLKSDLTERDFSAFVETLQFLQPDIVVIWGAIINSRLKEQNQYLVNQQELLDTKHYVCHIKVPGVDHLVALINPNHPSQSPWYSGMDDFDKFMLQLLNA